MQLIDAVADITAAAGCIIEEVRASTLLGISEKGSQGPVTEADRRADEFLRRELLRLVPGAWLSEETTDDQERLNSRRTWIVDPLDGTKEFIAGIPEYAVSVALVEEGRPLLGVVHNPATGETFRATRNGGVRLARDVIMCVTGTRLLASRSEMRSGEFAPFEKVGFELCAVGSIAYKLALVACGRGAVTLSRGPKWEWDVCAGSLIVTEAGGYVSDIHGDPLQFNQPFPKVRGIVAGQRDVHRRTSGLVREVGASDRMAEFGHHP